MTKWETALQVELVGGTWLDYALPLAAIVISLATLGWTIWNRERDKARLKVEVTSFVTFGPLGNKWYVAFEATNVGYAGSTVVTGFHFRAPEGKAPEGRYMHVPDSALPVSTLPATIQPGQSVTWVVRIESLAAQCRDLGVRPKDLEPFVSTGHRRFKGKWRKVALDLVEASLNEETA